MAAHKTTRLTAQSQTNLCRRTAEPHEQSGLAWSRCCRTGQPKRRPQLKASNKSRLCWTRRQLVEASGLSYRTIQNLEARGLLHRCVLGVNVVCYTEKSVRALFGTQRDDPA